MRTTSPRPLPVQRRLAALNPLDPDEVQDLGVLCLQADRPGEAVDPLRAYLAGSTEAAEAPEIRPCSRSPGAAWPSRIERVPWVV